MHASQLCLLLCASLVNCKTLSSAQKNGGTVHFDNDEIYSNDAPHKAGPKTSPPMASGDLEKPLHPPPALMQAPLHPAENSNNVGKAKPMSSQSSPPGAPASATPPPSSFIFSSLLKPTSIEAIINKPQSVNVPEYVLHKKKDVLKDTRIHSILQRGITQMTLDMDRAIRAQGAKYDNAVFAPLSLIGALALVLLGSGGSTKDELIKFMGVAVGRNLDNKTDTIHKTLGGFFDALTEGPPGAPPAADVGVANGVFYEERFQIKKQYEQLAREFYKTEFLSLDFGKQESAQFVNKWVSNRTMGKIANLLPGPLSPQITLILANVIYFNGKWEYPFSPKYNSWDPFDLYSGDGHKEVVRVEMMTNMARVEYSNSSEAQIIGLPYKGKQLYMYFVLPKNPDLDEYTKDLDYDKFSKIIDSTQDAEVIYSLPKVKVSSNIGLRPVLNSMNVTSMFDVNKSDLSNMLVGEGRDSGVAVDQVFHKVDMDINELGTEAAASTGIVITRISKPIVKMNRPFIFFIFHRTANTVVFWGRMNKPDAYKPY